MTPTATTTSRPVEAAIDWVERLTGGRVVARRHVERWRPQWFVDVETPDGSLRSYVLRDYRNPGYTRGAKDEAGSRAMLATEAKVLAALEPLPVATPGYVGHEPDLGWLLMEFVPGDTALTAIDDEDRRFAIFQGYVEELARLHAVPLGTSTFRRSCPGLPPARTSWTGCGSATSRRTAPWTCRGRSRCSSWACGGWTPRPCRASDRWRSA